MLSNSFRILLASVLCLSISTELVKASTVGYWRFEEGTAGSPVGTGNVVDSSGNGNHGTGSSGVGTLDYSSSVPGITINPGALPNSLSLDAEGLSGSGISRVAVPDSASLASVTTGITIEAFINTAADGTDRNGIASKWKGSGIAYQFRTNSTGQLHLILAHDTVTGGNSQLVSTDPVPANQWIHVAATWSDSDDIMRIYVDGVLNGTGAYGGISLNPGNADLWIGGNDGGTDHQFNGMIDELRISDVALLPSEFLMAVPLPPSGLKALIHPGSGEIVLRNETALDIDMNGYHIESPASALDSVAWNSLDEQNYDSVGAGVGESWEEVGSSDSSNIAELFLNSSSILSPGEAVSIGDAYDTAMSSTGIELTYHETASGNTINGLVEIVLLGDMDDDGDVDDDDVNPFVQALTDRAAFDLAHPGVYADLVGDFNENGRLDLGDISGFKAAAAGVGLGSANNVPEPSSLGLLFISLLYGLRFVRLKTNR